MNKIVESLVLTDEERKEMESRFDRQILFHSCVAGAAGLLPIPGATAIANAANQIVMYKKLNDIADVKFSKAALRCIAKFIVSQTAGVAVAGGFVLAEALKIIPGPGTFFGAAMEAAAGAAVTYVCGKVYCKAVGNLLFSGRKVEVDAVNSCIEDLCRDEKFVESLRKEAKSRLKDADYSKFAKEAENASRDREEAA